jgi:hypothetical protein
MHKTKTNQANKHNTLWFGHHYTQDTRRRQTKQETQHNMPWTPLYTNTNNVNKAWALLQTTGGKSTANIVHSNELMYDMVKSDLNQQSNQPAYYQWYTLYRLIAD